MNDHCRLVSTVKHPKQQSNADKSELSVSVKPLVPMGADDHAVYGRGFSCGKPPAWWLNTDSTAAGTRRHHLTDTCTQPEPEKNKQIESLKKGLTSTFIPTYYCSCKKKEKAPYYMTYCHLLCDSRLLLVTQVLLYDTLMKLCQDLCGCVAFIHHVLTEKMIKDWLPYLLFCA